MNLDLLRSPANWLAFGIVLGILELLLPGYVLLGFGIGAAAVAGVLFVVGPEPFAGFAGIAYLAVAWAVASYLAWLGVRRLPSARANNTRLVEQDVNDAPYKGDRD